MSLEYERSSDLHAVGAEDGRDLLIVHVVEVQARLGNMTPVSSFVA
jgi:hypothetical protein